MTSTTRGYLIFSQSSAPGLNLTTFFAGILISLPVWGLRSFRAERFETLNEPNPTSETLFPFFYTRTRTRYRDCSLIAPENSC